MIVTELSAENIRTYRDHFPAVFIDEIEREYYRGLVGEDESTHGVKTAVFWELKNTEDDNAQTEAEIQWFFAENAKDGAALLKEIELVPEFDEIRRLFYELPDLGSVEKEALAAAGFSAEEAEGRDVYATIGELSTLNLAINKVPDYIKPLKEISSQQFKSGVMTSVFHGRYGLLEDLPFLPMTRFEPELSCCMITDDHVNGLLLVDRQMSGDYRVELLFAMQPEANIHLLQMMRYAVRVASKLCAPDEKVQFRRHNKASAQLVGKLFPGKKGIPVLRGVKKCTQGDLL